MLCFTNWSIHGHSGHHKTASFTQPGTINDKRKLQTVLNSVLYEYSGIHTQHQLPAV